MNQRQRFIRKIIYISIIVALLVPLYGLSQPETKESSGGSLAQMRSQYRLGQAQLGEIDPASETIKLALLGMRGVAVNVLWTKAHEYRKTEDWVNLSATLEQMARLQPNFVSVWVYQGWNLSYNISVEFDDYHDRYYWVIKGINYLKEGTQYNVDEPRLLSKIGWTIAQKIGRADEHVQYRRLFREDDDFNGSLPRAQRDNWLVGRTWLVDAEKVVAKGVPLRGDSPLLFHSHPVMCLINYAEALEEEGHFGEVAKNAWRRANEAWTEYSKRDMPTQYNVFIRLGDKEAFEERAKQAGAELERLAPPGIAEKIVAERIAALSEEERRIHETPLKDLSDEDSQMKPVVVQKLKVHAMDIAERVEGEDRAAALKAGEDATHAEAMINAIDIERGIVNYSYWKLRCEIEPQDDTLEARRLVYDGDQAFTGAELVKAKESYVAGMARWRKVLDAYPKFMEDASITDELVESIDHYRGVLNQLGEEFPKPFVLQEVVDANDRFRGSGVPINRPGAHEASAEENDPAKMP